MRRLAKTAPIALRTFLSWLVCCGAFTVARAAPDAAPPDIRFVPEMERVAELEWSRADAKDFAEDRQRMLAAWKEISGAVQQKLTAAQVINLSKWAKPQMQSYADVPALDRPDFQLQTASAGEKKLLFEATLEVLPTHSPLVTRWLKVFVIYDQSRRAISQVVVTIRGEVQE